MYSVIFWCCFFTFITFLFLPTHNSLFLLLSSSFEVLNHFSTSSAISSYQQRFIPLSFWYHINITNNSYINILLRFKNDLPINNGEFNKSIHIKYSEKTLHLLSLYFTEEASLYVVLSLVTSLMSLYFLVCWISYQILNCSKFYTNFVQNHFLL